MSTAAPIRFTEEHVTVKSLARALGKKTPELFQELLEAGERPVYGTTLTDQSILGWGTIQKACKKAGFEAIDERQPSKGASISKEEWAVLKPAAKEAAAFHRTYGETLQQALGKESPGLSELLAFHNSAASRIEESIIQVDRQFNHGKKPDEPSMS